MIDRYRLEPMTTLWSDEARLQRWVEVERAIADAQAEAGVVPAEAAEILAATAPPTQEQVAAAEQVRDHEILSFLDAWTSSMPPLGRRWVHHGITSYDVVDTALAMALRDATTLVLRATADLQRRLLDLAHRHRETECIGRTHGMHAEPTTFGRKMAAFAFAVERSLERLHAARERVATGTVSGAVGTYSTTSPAVEAVVLGRLGLVREPVPTQVVARDRHAEVVFALALLGTTVEQLALELRLLQRSEVAEVSEPRLPGYQGSSVMPHKRNPTTAERLSGLGRLLRSYVAPTLENVPLWHERDLAHQSVERVVLPDAFALAHFQVHAMTDLLAGLHVDVDAMAATVREARLTSSSSNVLMVLTNAGVDRDDAYRIVQSAVDESRSSGLPLEEVLRHRGHPVGSAVAPARADDDLLDRLETLDPERWS